MKGRLSKIRSVNTYVIPRTVYFGWICIYFLRDSSLFRKFHIICAFCQMSAVAIFGFEKFRGHRKVLEIEQHTNSETHLQNGCFNFKSKLYLPAKYLRQATDPSTSSIAVVKGFPLSRVSNLAMYSALFSIKSASLNINLPLAEASKVLHVDPNSKAYRRWFSDFWPGAVKI